VRLSLNEAFLDVHLYDQYWLLITVRAQALSLSLSLALHNADPGLLLLDPLQIEPKTGSFRMRLSAPMRHYCT